MKTSRELLTVARLIAIKREELEVHRLDLLRLRQLLSVEEKRLGEIEAEELHLLDAMREAQSGVQSLDPVAMMESRRYLLVVQARGAAQKSVCDDIAVQGTLAQNELERVYSEIRSLERLSERKLFRAAQEEKRVAYLQADDQETTRVSNGKVDHVSH